jgi:hypothetical protein
MPDKRMYVEKRMEEGGYAVRRSGAKRASAVKSLFVGRPLRLHRYPGKGCACKCSRLAVTRRVSPAIPARDALALQCEPKRSFGDRCVPKETLGTSKQSWGTRSHRGGTPPRRLRRGNAAPVPGLVFHRRRICHDEDMAGPATSVVIATYNRSRALRCAIESVLRQTFTDWELIVVGDGCTDDTAEVVGRYLEADPRVRFVNLERNWGEQSAPNNVGRSLARAPLIAYLSHDDLWLPHHLKACSEAVAATRSDVVLGAAANVTFEDNRLAFDQLHVVLQGLGEGNRWSPSDLHASVAPASCWVIRTDALDRVGGWRMSYDERAEPSQALLFRLWGCGFRIHALNDLTLVILTAGTRPNSYLERETPTQDWILKQVDDPSLPAELAARACSTNASAHKRMPRRPPQWRRFLAGLLARV